ncbi:ribonuclease H [Synechococcus sp. GFB01]|uniref:ribonuclease H family protein n=1 Tax=Synechococcus sp. GFB01 TaxID=1662190 RepID=UPI00064E33BF|nr:ribonuclease H [Synechococcus sp. GFB01]KMM17010.1 ribonuclease HI [Synechococcus sp. GFB01]
MASETVRVVAAACDGACSGNPGPGGWGALLRFENGAVHEMGGAERATTNNRMELTAALALLETLKDLPRHPDLVIRTDSRYLIDGLSTWLPAWKRRGWRTASGGAVLNRDLWEQLDRARLADVSLQHVRGHSGDPDNERCDAIAVAFSRGQLPELAAGEVLATARLEADVPPGPAPTPAPAPAAELAGEPAPPALQRLLSRLELADRLAERGYSLSLVELAQLVELPVRQLEQRREAWPWRDWLVKPQVDGHWRLERHAGGLDRGEAAG